jgi:hypothetical protein
VDVYPAGMLATPQHSHTLSLSVTLQHLYEKAGLKGWLTQCDLPDGLQ